MTTPLGNEIDRLRKENEALKKDAARYRWLRDSSFDGHLYVVHDKQPFRSMSHMRLDATIDEAIAKEKA